MEGARRVAVVKKKRRRTRASRAARVRQVNGAIFSGIGLALIAAVAFLVVRSL